MVFTELCIIKIIKVAGVIQILKVFDPIWIVPIALHSLVIRCIIGVMVLLDIFEVGIVVQAVL